MLTLLTSVIGIFAKGRAAKAIAGGLGGLIITAIGPATKSFQSGFGQGIGTSVEELGLVAGQIVGGFIVGYVITWLAPKNEDAAS
jgi:hypothetical protein